MMTDTYTQAAFNSNHEDRARLFIELMMDKFREDEAIYDYESEPEPIETRSYDGFIPYTSGGYHTCLPAALSVYWSNGSAPAAVQALIDSGCEMIADEWKRQHGSDFNAAVSGELGEAVAQEAQEFESESWQSDTDSVFWKARCMFLAPDDRQNERGEPEVYLDAYLCTDSYGRDDIPWLSCYGAKADQTSGTFKRTFAASAFENLNDADIEALVAQAVKELP